MSLPKASMRVPVAEVMELPKQTPSNWVKLQVITVELQVMVETYLRLFNKPLMMELRQFIFLQKALYNQSRCIY